MIDSLYLYIIIKDQKIMKILTKKIKREAEVIIKIDADTDIPLSGLPLIIAKAELKCNGFYGYTRVDLNNQKILLIS